MVHAKYDYNGTLLTFPICTIYVWKKTYSNVSKENVMCYVSENHFWYHFHETNLSNGKTIVISEKYFFYAETFLWW